MNKYLLFCTQLICACFTACIGVDIIPDEEIFSPQIMISSSLDTLKAGDNFPITATVTDKFGAPIDNPSIIWNSLSPDNVSITDNGIVKGIKQGPAIITAQYEELIDSLSFYVGENTVMMSSRAINFSGRNGYNVTGTGTLREEAGEIILDFNADFSSDSGPGLVVYLSNSTTSVQGGVELVALKSNSGSQSYNVTQILNQNSNTMTVGLSTYNHVIIYCKPFGVLFGIGSIQN